MRLVHFICAQPNKTLAQGKVCGRKIQKDCLTLALAINTTSIDKLKFVINYKSLCPRCFGRWLPTNYVWWFANQMAWMTSCVFESWMMSLNVHSKSQKRKVLLSMDKFITHSLEDVDRDESFGFRPYNWAILLLLLLSYYLMLQVWYNPWISSRKKLLKQFSLRLIILLTMTWGI